MFLLGKHAHPPEVLWSQQVFYHPKPLPLFSPWAGTEIYNGLRSSRNAVMGGCPTLVTAIFFSFFLGLSSSLD